MKRLPEGGALRERRSCQRLRHLSVAGARRARHQAHQPQSHLRRGHLLRQEAAVRRRGLCPRTSEPEELLGKSHPILPEDRLAQLLGLIEVDIGRDAKVAVALGVPEGLADVPHVIGFLG